MRVKHRSWTRHLTTKFKFLDFFSVQSLTQSISTLLLKGKKANCENNYPHYIGQLDIPTTKSGTSDEISR